MAEIVHHEMDGEANCDYFGGCPNHIAYISALEPLSGWFVAKDGKVFCPIHVPIFAAEWRRKQVEE